MSLPTHSKHFYHKNRTAGFNLIELLVVIAIIGILASIIFAAVGQLREKAKIAKTIAEIKEFRTTLEFYRGDTGTLPKIDCMPDYLTVPDGTGVQTGSGPYCDMLDDPFINSMGVPGWNGPYGKSIYNRIHPWGGAFSYEFGTDNPGPPPGNNDYTGDGIDDGAIFLNDDRPGMGINDNSGQIPLNVLIAIDKAIDDGNLATGEARGDDDRDGDTVSNGWIGGGGGGQATAVGELVIHVSF